MKNSGLKATGFAILVFAAMRQPSVAAAAKPTADPSPSSNSKTKAKKTKTKAPARNKKAAIPSRPAADIPEVKEVASVWRGCLDSRDLPSFASDFGVEESRLAPLLAEQRVLGFGSGCVPYAAATGGEGGAASAILKNPEPDAGAAPTLDIRKTSDGITVTPGACDCPSTLRRVLEFPLEDAMQRPGEALAQVYGNLRWQLDILMPQMLRRIAAKQGPMQFAPAHLEADVSPAPASMVSDSERLPDGGQSASGRSVQMVRIVLARQDETAPERLQSIEILDSATGKNLDGLWWFERNDGPGVFMSMEGIAYERLLWQSPVKYVQTSRGIGAAVTTYNVRVAAPPKGEKGKPTTRKVTVREYHLGADLIAPKGTEVHAVGEAKVFFAGRYGGYGNLIILDHGLGYQTYYAHLSVIKPQIKVGAKVLRGDVIGLVGSTGHSTAPHLHYETRKDGKYIDPFDDTRQLEFWVLSPDDQERLGMEMLASSSSASIAQHGGIQNPSR